MGIRSEEENLFAELRLKHPKLVRDGVVDPDTFVATSPRVVFVLKEVDGEPKDSAWDLWDFLQKGKVWQTWNNVARWADAIIDGPIEPWSHVPAVTNESRKAALRRIAVMNVKKLPGGASAEDQALRAAARDNRDLLKRQLALYEPDVVVWCGVWWLRSEIYEAAELPESRETRRGVQYATYEGGRFDIGFWHPQARVDNSLLYYSLVDALPEVRGAAIKGRHSISA